MKTECDYLYAWVKNGYMCKNLTKKWWTPEIQLKTKKKKKKTEQFSFISHHNKLKTNQFMRNEFSICFNKLTRCGSRKEMNGLLRDLTMPVGKVERFDNACW